MIFVEWKRIGKEVLGWKYSGADKELKEIIDNDSFPRL